MWSEEISDSQLFEILRKAAPLGAAGEPHVLAPFEIFRNRRRQEPCNSLATGLDVFTIRSSTREDNEWF
jgi:hypothetical protein